MDNQFSMRDVGKRTAEIYTALEKGPVLINRGGQVVAVLMNLERYAEVGMPNKIPPSMNVRTLISHTKWAVEQAQIEDHVIYRYSEPIAVLTTRERYNEMVE